MTNGDRAKFLQHRLIRSVAVTSHILINHLLPSKSASSSTPSHVTPPRHAHASPLWVHLMLTDLTKRNLLFCLCTYSTVLSQSHSGGSGDVHLGKTSFVQKGRSMFPKVLLQWCAAISSCAAEIGKPLHGSTMFVCLLCQQATCAVRLWHLAATTLSHAIGLWLLSGPLWCRAGVTIKWCRAARERWEAASCCAAAILWCSCILVKGISLLL